MILCYMDEIGACEVEIDEHGVQIVNGYAFFSDGNRNYTVPVNNVLAIMQE